MAVNPMAYSSKDLVLDVVRTERARFYKVIDNPENWLAETRCEGWQVRDLVGHMIDVSEGYLARWELARRGEYPEARGLKVMADDLNKGALAFRGLPREEAITRLKTAADRLLETFEHLGEKEWGRFNVGHVFMGPLPTLFYPAFQIMDYTVHSWDMHWGLGDKEGQLDERSAGVLLPYMFILWQATVDEEAARDLDLSYGIKVDGTWGGQWKIQIQNGQLSYAPAEDLSDVPAILHFKHPSELVLTAYQRIQGGEASGDPKIIKQVRGLFFRI